MTAYDYDLFVIGAGSGGVRGARVAAGHGARVAVAEEAALGGTCVNVGCVPKKLFVYASEFARAFGDAVGFGWSLPERPTAHDFAALVAAKNKEIARLNAIYERLLENSGVELLRGHASLEDAHHVRVGERVVSAQHILLAPGGEPYVPPIPGSHLAVTSNELFFLPQVPKRILVVGGGYIAVEFAGIFNGFGAEVVLAYRGSHLLRGFDHDVRTTISEEVPKSGIDLRFGLEPIAIHEEPDGAKRVTMQNGSFVDADLVVMATGRVPKLGGLQLERAGVVVNEAGAIAVDAHSRTNVPHIYAVGDVTDRIQLTPVAIAEGHAVADSLFGGRVRTPDYDNVPSAVFSQPQVATVGLTEAEARDRLARVRIYRTRFKGMKATLSGRDERTMMKLIVDDATDRVVGCHMVGPDAGEIIQGLAVALKAGATKAHFDATIGIHPTAAEEFVTMRTPVSDA